MYKRLTPAERIYFACTDPGRTLVSPRPSYKPATLTLARDSAPVEYAIFVSDSSGAVKQEPKPICSRQPATEPKNLASRF